MRFSILLGDEIAVHDQMLRLKVQCRFIFNKKDISRHKLILN